MGHMVDGHPSKKWKKSKLAHPCTADVVDEADRKRGKEIEDEIARRKKDREGNDDRRKQ